jgi:hypothetical protein
MSVGDYLPVQVRADLESKDFIRYSGPAMNVVKGIYLQDGSRSIDLEQYTVMAKRASSQKWRSFVNETATNGEAIPQGIYVGPTIPAADIVAGDVSGLSILIADAWFDQNMLVFENAKSLTTVITVGTTDVRVVEDHLRGYGLIPLLTTQHSGGEN